MPAEAVSGSCADESEFDRFDDLVLASTEGKTLFVSIASSDEAEDEPRQVAGDDPKSRPGGSPADDVASDMTDVKNDLVQVRGAARSSGPQRKVRRNQGGDCGQKTGQDRMEREQHEADDAEHDANLQEALTNQPKAVKVHVDKWFVDKGYGFGRAPTGEIVFINAGAVQGAEVLTIGTDAWCSSPERGIELGEPGSETCGRSRGTKRKRTKWHNK